MTFIVTLLSLLIERFFDWSHVRRFKWYEAYQTWLLRRLPFVSPFLLLVLSVSPPLLLVAIINYSLQNKLYGFLLLLFNLLIFLYCLGPKNLWADTYACINASHEGQLQFATEKLKFNIGLKNSKSPHNLHRRLAKRIFIAANQRIFAIIIWYGLLGPVGALLYRLVSLSADYEEQPAALFALELLDWLPARLLAFLFALSGQFVPVLASFKNHLAPGLENNDNLLVECGMAAISHPQEIVSEDGLIEEQALSLLDRSLVLVILVMAISTFAPALM